MHAKRKKELEGTRSAKLLRERSSSHYESVDLRYLIVKCYLKCMTLGPTKSISWISLHNPNKWACKNSHGFPRLSKEN